jgi:hypothetical protein
MPPPNRHCRVHVAARLPSCLTAANRGEWSSTSAKPYENTQFDLLPPACDVPETAGTMGAASALI